MSNEPEPYTESDVMCPWCAIDAVKQHRGRKVVWVCPKCAFAWYDKRWWKSNRKLP